MPMNALWKLVALALLLGSGSAAGAASGSDLLLLHGHIYTGVQKAPVGASPGRDGIPHRRGGNRCADARDAWTADARDRPSRAHRDAPASWIRTFMSGWERWDCMGSICPRPKPVSRPPSPRSCWRGFAITQPTIPAEKIISGARISVPRRRFRRRTSSWIRRRRPARHRPQHFRARHVAQCPGAGAASESRTNRCRDPGEERNVVRDAGGHATGIVIEAAMEAVERYVKATLTQEEQLSMIRVAMRELNSYGITSVVNATGDLSEIRLYAALRDRRRLDRANAHGFRRRFHAASAHAAISRGFGGGADQVPR